MANMTADIEQLLAELVRITTKIAALVNATGTNASDDSDSLTSTANRLSLFAAIFAVAAFLIASLQAILEYSSSGESARRKCNSSAIGSFSKYVHKEWSFRQWRRKFYYPVLRQDMAFEYDPWKPPKPQNPGRGNRIMRSMKRRLKLGGGALDLQLRPRATWAQLLSLGGIDVEQALMGDTYVDVDSIPGSLDIPPQMVSVVDLGILAIFMGFDSFRMNAQERDFQAVGKAGSITTEDLTGFGRVLRFQKHNDDQSLLFQKWRKGAISIIEGRFLLSPGVVLSFIEPQLRDVDGMRIQADAMVSAWEKAMDKRNISASSDTYENAINPQAQDMGEVLAIWRDTPARTLNHITCPSILKSLAIAGFPCAFAGFPARVLLIPFLGLCRQISRALCKKMPSLPLENNLILERQDFLRLMKTTRDPSPLTIHGISHWLFDTSKCFGDTHSMGRYIKRIRESKPLGTELGEGLFLKWQMILNPIVDLINNFDPRGWAQSLHKGIKDPVSDFREEVIEAQYLLKTQIILLDISIYFLFKVIWEAYDSQIPFRGINFQGSGRQFFNWDLMMSVIKSEADIDEFSSRLFENLDLGLADDPSMDAEATAAYQHLMSEMAGFLRLRVVLYAAYLMVIPDTSDILDTQRAVGYNGFILPMI
ncbi:hypothetical protein F4803DRAFT_244991 [Xylaria telfairii]|nr:hypothetical protein F4803DRAFT_244991 [Xylaria telfairii]